MNIRDQVTEFHRMIDAPVVDVPTAPPEPRARLRARLVAEEAFELLAAIFPHAGWARLRAEVFDKIDQEEVDVNLPELADALADLDYVAEGTRLECGIDGAPIAAEVHSTNMAKANGPVDANGKKRKPAGWKPPDIARLLREQGWQP